MNFVFSFFLALTVFFSLSNDAQAQRDFDRREGDRGVERYDKERETTESSDNFNETQSIGGIGAYCLPLGSLTATTICQDYSELMADLTLNLAGAVTIRPEFRKLGDHQSIFSILNAGFTESFETTICLHSIAGHCTKEITCQASFGISSPSIDDVMNFPVGYNTGYSDEYALVAKGRFIGDNLSAADKRKCWDALREKIAESGSKYCYYVERIAGHLDCDETSSLVADDTGEMSVESLLKESGVGSSPNRVIPVIKTLDNMKSTGNKLQLSK